MVRYYFKKQLYLKFSHSWGSTCFANATLTSYKNKMSYETIS